MNVLVSPVSKNTRNHVLRVNLVSHLKLKTIHEGGTKVVNLGKSNGGGLRGKVGQTLNTSVFTFPPLYTHTHQPPSSSPISISCSNQEDLEVHECSRDQLVSNTS